MRPKLGNKKLYRSGGRWRVGGTGRRLVGRREGIGVLEAAANSVPRLAAGEAGWLGEAGLLGGWAWESAGG